MNNSATFAEAILAMAQVVLFASFLALVLERITELLIKPPLTSLKNGRFLWLIPYLASALGILTAVSFGVDLAEPIATALGLKVAWPIFGEILTGLVIGGGSNLIHDVWPGRGVVYQDRSGPEG